MLIVGLTGNYGMGKSTVLKMFRRLGAAVLETDSIVDALLNKETVLEEIRKALGDNVFSADGKLDRAKAAYIIFKDKEQRDALEEILHPLVFKMISEFINNQKKNSEEDKIAIIEIPLLFEREYDYRFNKAITVYTDNETALKRLEKSGIRREDAMLRLNVQMPVDEKIKMSDFAIDNSGTLIETEEQVKTVYAKLIYTSGLSGQAGQ